MGSIMQLPQEAARIWGDPTRRAEIVQMHNDGRSFVEMVDALDLRAALEADGLLEIVENLSAADVTIIRDAFLSEATRAGTAGGASLPIDCRVENPTARVRVTEVPGSRDGVMPIARID